MGSLVGGAARPPAHTPPPARHRAVADPRLRRMMPALKAGAKVLSVGLRGAAAVAGLFGLPVDVPDLVRVVGRC